MTHASDPARLLELLQRMDAVSDGEPSPDTIPSGFPSLDRVLGGGFRHGDLVVLGGDVGSGKSSLSLAIALRAAQQQRRVAFLTAEMSPERTMERALAIEGRVRIDDLRQGRMEETARASVGAAVVRLRDAMPVIERLPSNGVEDVRRRLKIEPRPELVVVDSLQSLGDGTHRSSDEELAAAVRSLKALALDANVAILATSQLPLLTLPHDLRQSSVRGCTSRRAASRARPSCSYARTGTAALGMSTSISTPSGCGSKTCWILTARRQG
jgi:replicative DNA helicase